MQDPDANVIATFSVMAIKNESKSAKAGRPIFDDMEVVQLRYGGKRDSSVQPATSVSHWATDPETGEQRQITYAERFSRQYRQFKEHSVQTKSGTPLNYAPFLTEARRAELRALNLYTVEALATIEGNELKNLGLGGRDLKNQAMAYIDEAKRGAPNTQMLARLEALEARNVLLEEDNKLLKARAAVAKVEEADNFEDMTVEQLSDYVEANTGQKPRGSPSKKTLIRMARSLKLTEQAA